MQLPQVGTQRSVSGTSSTRLLSWRPPTERLMDAVTVVIDAERFQLVPQIKRIPEKHAIEILAVHGADASPAEILVLRRQLAKYMERSIKPRRMDALTRIGLALFTGLFDLGDTFVLVRPATFAGIDWGSGFLGGTNEGQGGHRSRWS